MTPVVRLDGIGRTYAGPPPVPALVSIDLTVAPGEYLTVVGPSGSGKSTFLNVVGLLDRPTEGVYTLDGVDVGALGDKRRTAMRGQHIGFVFQSFHLMPNRTAKDNVALPLLYGGARPRERVALATEALENVGLAQRARAIANTLSGGEQQRVAIARAMVHQPRLLLCDEPTGNLDTGTADAVLALLDELHSDGVTLIVITHDPVIASRGQRTIGIIDGRLS